MLKKTIWRNGKRYRLAAIELNKDGTYDVTYKLDMPPHLLKQAV